MTTPEPTSRSFDYGTYLGLDRLLALQVPRSNPPEHDEILFLVIHQVYELWFKLLLHEVEKLKRDFAANELFGAIHTFKRARTVMKTLVSQVDILETMTPMSFGSFRDRLETASGFQSVQFRELEFVLGYKRPEMLRFFDRDGDAYRVLERRLDEPSLVDHFHEFLARRGVEIPEEVRLRDRRAPTEPNATIQEALLRLYKGTPSMTILFELMTDLDEGLQEWRYRHVKLVERTIGSKKGTGGSLGVAFLKKSLFLPVFPDLWAIRHQL
jgi:tryptophan 2,3-dioxygenase